MPAPPRSVLGVGANAYYHFTLARMASLLGVRDLDGVNWYAAGTATITARQEPSGAWRGPGRPAPDLLHTAWNLGFLVRAGLPAVPDGDRELK